MKSFKAAAGAFAAALSLAATPALSQEQNSPATPDVESSTGGGPFLARPNIIVEETNPAIESSTGGDPYPARPNVIVEEPQDPAAPLIEHCLPEETATACVHRAFKIAEQENKLVVAFFKAQEQGQIVPIAIKPDGEFRLLQPSPASPTR